MPEGPDDTFGFDLPCTQCGYNLRGSQPGSRCSECGQPNMVSLETHVLRSGLGKYDARDFLRKPVDWLRNVNRGAVLALGANLSVVALVLLRLASGGWPRYSVARYTALGLYSLAVAFSALAFWRQAGAMGIMGRLVVRAGALAAVAIPTFYGLSDRVFYGHIVNGRIIEFPEWIRTVSALGLLVAAWVLALATVCRTAYVAWWIRLERQAWLGWMMLFGSIFPVFVLAALGLGDINFFTSSSMVRDADPSTFDVIVDKPLGTLLTCSVFDLTRRYLWARSIHRDAFVSLITWSIALLQLVPFLADGYVFLQSRRALKWPRAAESEVAEEKS